MALNNTQIKLTKAFHSRMSDQIEEYSTAPEDITKHLDEVWAVFKKTAKFDDNDQATLAAFGALAQFARMADSFEDKDLKSLLSLFSISLLTKITKSD